MQADSYLNNVLLEQQGRLLLAFGSGVGPPGTLRGEADILAAQQP